MTVHLVGAGPGDADLLTVKAARLVAAADVIVHDRLAEPSILTLARADVNLSMSASVPAIRHRKRTSTRCWCTSVVKASKSCA